MDDAPKVRTTEEIQKEYQNEAQHAGDKAYRVAVLQQEVVTHYNNMLDLNKESVALITSQAESSLKETTT